jgi:predicted transposase YdaD
MPITFDIKTDYIYQRGREDAEKDFYAILETEREKVKQEREKAIRKMLKANLDIETIAEFSSLSLEEATAVVEKIKAENDR